MAYKSPKALNIFFALLFPLVLIACVADAPQRRDLDNKTLSGNSFSVKFGDFDGVFYFAPNGDLSAFGYKDRSFVLEGKWDISPTPFSNELWLIADVYALNEGFRYKSGINFSRDIKFLDDGTITIKKSLEKRESRARAVKGFPRQAEYNTLLQKIKSAPLPPPGTPEPGKGPSLLGLAIGVPVCILSALMLCI